MRWYDAFSSPTSPAFEFALGSDKVKPSSYSSWVDTTTHVYICQPVPELVTQFGRMCAKLGIGIIAASSPQAKGRVERNHGTHQDRLIKKLRRKNISRYEAANQFLAETYLPEHNRRYSRAAASEEDFHRAKPSLRRLEEIFCLEQERRLSNDWVVRYEGRFLQIERDSYHHAPAQAKVVVQEWENGKLEIRYRGRKIAWKEIRALPERPLTAKTDSAFTSAATGSHTSVAERLSRNTYSGMGSAMVKKSAPEKLLLYT